MSGEKASPIEVSVGTIETTISMLSDGSMGRVAAKGLIKRSLKHIDTLKGIEGVDAADLHKRLKEAIAASNYGNEAEQAESALMMYKMENDGGDGPSHDGTPTIG